MPGEKLAQALPLALKLRIDVFHGTKSRDMPPSRLLQLFRHTLFGPLEMILNGRGRQPQALGDFEGRQPFAHSIEQDAELLGSPPGIDANLSRLPSPPAAE